MSIERIGYRYNYYELAALLHILRLPPISGIETPELDIASYSHATDELITKNLILQSGAQVYVDRISALLLKTMTDSSVRIEVRSDRRSTLLYHGNRLCIAADRPSGASCILTPFPSFQEAVSALDDSLSRRRGSVQLLLFDKGSEPLHSLSCADAAEARKQIDSLIDKALALISGVE